MAGVDKATTYLTEMGWCAYYKLLTDYFIGAETITLEADIINNVRVITVYIVVGVQVGLAIVGGGEQCGEMSVIFSLLVEI